MSFGIFTNSIQTTAQITNRMKTVLTIPTEVNEGTGGLFMKIRTTDCPWRKINTIFLKYLIEKCLSYTFCMSTTCCQFLNLFSMLLEMFEIWQHNFQQCLHGKLTFLWTEASGQYSHVGQSLRAGPDQKCWSGPRAPGYDTQHSSSWCADGPHFISSRI